MPHLAVSAIGRDRPGIVAALAAVLVEHGANIEDSQATILRGHFTIMLVLAAPAELDREKLEADLDNAGRELGLEALTVRDIDEVDSDWPEPSHTVTVYGVDHPGIVHAAAVALAGAGANITELNTRVVEEGADDPLYVLMMEVAFPAGASPEALRSALDEVGRREGVEVSLHELERDAL